MNRLMTEDGKIMATHNVTVTAVSVKPLSEKEKGEIEGLINEMDESKLLSLESFNVSKDSIEIVFYISVLDPLSSEYGICHSKTVELGIKTFLFLKGGIHSSIDIKNINVKQILSSAKEANDQFVILY